MNFMKYNVKDLLDFNFIRRTNIKKYIQFIINEYLNYIKNSKKLMISSTINIFKRYNSGDIHLSKRSELRNSLIGVIAGVVALILGIYILYIVISFVGKRKKKKEETIGIEVDGTTITDPTIYTNNPYLQQNNQFYPSSTSVSHSPSFIMNNNPMTRPTSQIYTPHQSYYSSYNKIPNYNYNNTTLQNYYNGKSNYQTLLNYPQQQYYNQSRGLRHSYSAPFYLTINSMSLPPPPCIYNSVNKKANSVSIQPNNILYSEPMSYNTNQ